MINLLAIETSGAVCSACLSMDGNRFVISQHAERRHNEMLLPMLSELRKQAGVDQPGFRKQLDGVAFGCGPGSFTGVRIAAATAQAIALATAAPVARVPSSQALARKAFEELPDTPGAVTLIRSRRELYYLAAYSNESGVPVCVQNDRLCEDSPPDEWYQRYEQWQVAGETPDWWRGATGRALLADAAQIHDLGIVQLRRGEGVDAAEALPEYLSADSPWQKSR